MIKLYTVLKPCDQKVLLGLIYDQTPQHWNNVIKTNLQQLWEQK